MANDLDKFTLQYQVDLKDSIRKLEELHKKMSEVGKAHEETASKLKDFVADASGELGKLIPGMDAVGAAARGMGAGFGVAAVALAALAVSVKAVMTLRTDIHTQTALGMNLGVSGTRVEDYQRQFVAASGGTVDREGAASGLTKFKEMSRAAYRDASSPAARALAELGVKPGVLGEKITPFNEQMMQMGERLKGMSPEKVQGLAGASGLDKDWLLTLQKLGPSIGHISEMTMKDLEKRKAAEKDMAELDKNLAALSESFHELTVNLGMLVAGPMGKFVKQVADLVGLLNKPEEERRSAAYKALGVAGPLVKSVDDFLSGRDGGAASTGGATGSWGDEPTTGGAPGGWSGSSGDKPATAADLKKNLDDDVTERDRQQMAADQAQAEFDRIINQFSGAVQSFAGAIDTQQAWAAWAGEIGKAAGLDGGGSKSPPRDSHGLSVPISGDVKAYLAETDSIIGAKPGTSVAQAQVESGGDASNLSPKGARGLMQIMPSIQATLEKRAGRKFDANNPMDSAIMHRMLMKENVAHFGNVEDSLRGYNGGWDKSTWGNSETAAYVGKINRAREGGSGSTGQGRNSLQLSQVQAVIGSYLGVGADEIAHGRATKGDAAWANTQMQAGIQDKINEMNTRLAKGNMPNADMAKLKLEIRDQERGLNLMKQYAPGIIGGQQEGAQSWTIGERAIVINMNGVTGDAGEIADKTHDAFLRGVNTLNGQIAQHNKG